MTNYLRAMTVKDLRTIASRLDIKGRSGMDKNTLLGHIGEAVETAHDQAILENFDRIELADEVYTVADVEGESNDSEPVEYPEGTVIKNGVVFFSGWQCCKARPAKVMTFDDGGKWAVCLSCASTVSPRRISDFSEHGLFVVAEPIKGTVPVIFDGATAELLIAHDKRVKRFNPNMRRDKAGMVCLTPKQRRRVQKNMRQHAKAVGFFV